MKDRVYTDTEILDKVKAHLQCNIEKWENDIRKLSGQIDVAKIVLSNIRHMQEQTR